ncbi:MAG TPA: LytTR family DNA-binding domain-containing protein [Thermoanaerobaculia bacterium]|nr:LytTR family DNA-binding domain-containing protein [Thermoanaerobaculia bacterium]
MKAAADTGVLIVDDEAPARSILREMLSALPGVRILAECANGFEAVKAASELGPDVVFLDIEMPKLDGFEVLELIDPAIAVVFVTAYDSYALKAFEVHAVDYVLKPFRAERLAAALDRARERAGKVSKADPAKIAAAARPAGTHLSRIVVRDGTRVHVIPAENLDVAEAQDDYVRLKSGGKSYLKQQTIASLAATLDPERFVRVHRSYVLNLDRLARLELYSRGSYAAVLSDGSRIPVSREGHARLKALLEPETRNH